jgi:hypothetical protein
MERAFSRDSLYSDNEFQNYPVKACRQELTKKLTSEMKEAGVSWDDPPMEESLADYVQDLVVQCMKKGEGGLISGYGEGMYALFLIEVVLRCIVLDGAVLNTAF